MKIKLPLKRFNSFGNVVTTKYVERFNGTHGKETVKKFQFCYAQIHNTVNNLLSNTGTTSNQNKLLASLNPRFKSYVNDSGSDQIQLDGTNYRISNVSVDDSNLTPLYEITITSQGSGNNDPSADNSSSSDSDNSGSSGWKHW